MSAVIVSAARSPIEKAGRYWAPRSAARGRPLVMWSRGPTVEAPAEFVHGPVVAGDAHRVADDPVLTRRLAGPDRGDAHRRAGGEAGADRAALVAGGEAGEEGGVLGVVEDEVPAQAVDQQQAGVADRRDVERVGMAGQSERGEEGGRDVAEGG